MAPKLWTRRQAMQQGAQIAAAAAIGSLARKSARAAQLPAPEPLQDDRVTFVTTTETHPWQTGAR